MKGIQNKKGVDLHKPVPSCMGRMVDLFDLSNNTKLLTEKPHRDGFSPRRSFSDDISMPIDQVAVLRGDKQRKTKQGGTPIKMLIEEEMWQEETETNQNPPSVIARLMGLNEFPGTVPANDEIAPRKIENSRKSDSSYEKKMALVRQKFAEAKHMATNEKLFHSKEFQDALQFLSSNRDLFVKFLEEPNSLFSNNNNAPPSPEIKHITVLKPSSELIKKLPKEHISVEDRESDVSLTKPTQPTRIVVLKPNLENIHDANRSIFESGYNGGDDDISFSKSESMNLDDDLDVYTPSSGRSWEFNNNNNSRIESPLSHASFKEAKEVQQQRFHEPRVIREAKKRLVERWEMVSSKEEEENNAGANGVISTLGEMLTINETKRDDEHRGPEERGNESSESPVSLHRSKSLPVCSSMYESGAMHKELEKSKSAKFKWRLLPSLFFSRSSGSKGLVGERNGCIDRQSNGVDRGGTENEEGSCSSSCHDSQENCDTSTKEVSSLEKIGAAGNTDQQPSPISVLETSFASDFADLSSLSDSSASLLPQALSRSTPIGSISRSLSWDSSQFETTSPNSLRLSRFFSKADEEQHNFTYITNLIALSKLEEGKSWYSPETPLDPSLYYNISGCNFDELKAKDKVLFDSVNEALVEIKIGTELELYRWCRVPNLDAKELKSDFGSSLSSEVCGIVRRWCMTFESPGGYNCGNQEVDLVTKREVSGAKLEKGLMLEMFDLNKEICGSILELEIDELILDLFN